jgi:hypothetical protein
MAQEEHDEEGNPTLDDASETLPDLHPDKVEELLDADAALLEEIPLPGVPTEERERAQRKRVKTSPQSKSSAKEDAQRLGSPE